MTDAVCSSESLQFFRAWTANPLRVASVAPSSNRLSRIMTQEISAATGPVIELGPGTGVFTRALLKRGVPEKNLVLVESGKEFVGRLRSEFAAASVLEMDAARLGSSPLHPAREVGAVLSGLPFLSMPSKKIYAILVGAFKKLREDGSLYLFTYGYVCPIPRRMLDRLGLQATRIGGTFANLPPAVVYRIKRSPMRHFVS